MGQEVVEYIHLYLNLLFQICSVRVNTQGKGFQIRSLLMKDLTGGAFLLQLSSGTECPWLGQKLVLACLSLQTPAGWQNVCALQPH